VVEPGTASEEKILVTRTGSTDTTINVASDSERGQDGTSAVSHSTGSTVFPVFTSVDADEANAVASVISADTTNSRIGIGTATPDFQFQVESGNEYVAISPTDNDAIRLASDTAAGRPFISFYNQDDVGSLVRKGYIGYPTNAQTTANSRFTINAGDGDSDLFIDAAAVGIGDNTPSYKLDVNGDINATGDLRIGGTAIGTWTSYTPSFTNFTLGNGTAIGRYAQVNDLVFVEGQVVLGSTSVMGSTPQIAHPVGTSSSEVFISNTLRYDETGVGNYLGTIWIYYNRINLGTLYTGSTWASVGWIGATSPFTWGTGDVFTWQYFYRKV